jgi:hypothetical protein
MLTDLSHALESVTPDEAKLLREPGTQWSEETKAIAEEKGMLN